MSKNLVLGLVAIVVLGGGFYLYSNRDSGYISPSPEPMPAPAPAPAPMPVSTTTTTTTTTETNSSVRSIQISDAIVAPAEIVVRKGDTVTFINNGQNDHWPASAMHPTHMVYPNSDIKKCGTSEQNNIFDACRGLKPGETYSFRFNEVGVWRWHDHLYTNLNGKITVNQ